jgi:hypothetical protein
MRLRQKMSLDEHECDALFSHLRAKMRIEQRIIFIPEGNDFAKELRDIQPLMVVGSVLASFSVVICTYAGSMSMPMYTRPNRFAAIAVVPATTWKVIREIWGAQKVSVSHLLHTR